MINLWRWWFGIPLSLRVAVGVWIALLVGVFVRVLIQPAAKQSVVPIYLTGGERWLRSEPLYPPIPGMDLYRNPPGVAALFAPLSLLPPKAAALLWRLACVLVYLAGVRSLVRDLLPPLPPWRRAVVWGLAAVLVLPAFNNGQINLMIVAAALVGAGACARGRWWTAAWWLAFAGWFKVYPFAVGLLCVMVAPRQLGWRLAVTTAVLFALPFLLQHPTYVWDRHVEFVHEMKADDRTGAEMSILRAPRDWTVLPRVWFDVAVPRAVSQPVALAAAAGLAAVVCAASRRSSLPTSPLEGEVGETQASRVGGGIQNPPPAPVAARLGSTSPSRGEVKKAVGVVQSATREMSPYLLALLLGLLWIVLFGPATEMNTYSVLAPVAGGVAVGSRSRWVAAGGWAASGLLLAAIVRASFPSDAPYKLVELQPIAGLLLLAGVIGWITPSASASAAGVAAGTRRHAGS